MDAAILDDILIIFSLSIAIIFTQPWPCPPGKFSPLASRHQDGQTRNFVYERVARTKKRYNRVYRGAPPPLGGADFFRIGVFKEKEESGLTSARTSCRNR